MYFLNAINEMNRIQQEFNQRFGMPYGRLNRGWDRAGQKTGRSTGSYPRINVHDLSDRVQVEALVSGLDPEKIGISVVGNTLTIQGVRVAQSGSVKAEAYHRSERSTGKFSRNIELLTDIDANAVEAEYHNGVLLVTLPKAEKALPRTIDVKFSKN